MADPKKTEETDATPAEDAAPGAPVDGADRADGAEPVADPGDAAGKEVAEPGFSVEDLIPGIGEAVEAETAQRVAELEAERDALKDRLLRALADVENIRRRSEREAKEAEARGGARLARDLLAVHDGLDRAIASADDALRAEHAAYFEGVELTQRELLKAFSKHRIEKSAPEKGDKFNPNLHQAMFEAPLPDAVPGTVIEVMQAGFVMGDRLLRPALVGVARAAPGAPASAPAPDSGAGTGEAHTTRAGEDAGQHAAKDAGPDAEKDGE